MKENRKKLLSFPARPEEPAGSSMIIFELGGERVAIRWSSERSGRSELGDIGRGPPLSPALLDLLLAGVGAMNVWTQEVVLPAH